MSWTITLSTFVVVTSLLFFYLLSKRLHGTHPAANPQPILTDGELADVSYNDIDMLKAIPSRPTRENYAVVGGSGYLGT